MAPPAHHRASSTPTTPCPPYTAARPKRNSSSASTAAPPHPSLLQPRVAVVLNVPPPWHPWLFALRLLSVLPAVWWGAPAAAELLLRQLPRGPQILAILRHGTADGGGEGEERYAVTEMALATIWCFASGYLSFFFTDCLMSRWLINYTPQATIVRLLTMNAVYAYVTFSILSLTGGFTTPRLFLPGWIGIATTLTVCYHISHQKINIRKETSTSINVFSIASFISMVTLLAHLHIYQPDYPVMPVVSKSQFLWDEVRRFMAQTSNSSSKHSEL